MPKLEFWGCACLGNKIIIGKDLCAAVPAKSSASFDSVVQGLTFYVQSLPIGEYGPQKMVSGEKTVIEV